MTEEMTHEHEMYNGKGLKGALWTIAGTTIGGLATSLLNGGVGGCVANNACPSNQFITRYELEMENKIVSKDSEIALLKSNIYTDQKLGDVFERLSNRIAGVEASVNQQAVVNATTISTLQCMQGQIAQLQSLTKLVVPNASVCPGWGTATVSIDTTATTTA